MADNNFIKRLTYSRPLRGLVRFFNLSSVFRKWYFFYARPRNGILNLEINGLKSQFYVKTPGELRILESMGGGGSGEQHVLKTLLSHVSSGDVFYDIGGHVGLYTIFLSKAVGERGRVIAFEPDLQNYQHILNNKTLNNVLNVTVFNKALGNKNEEVKLYLGEDGGNSSLLAAQSIDYQIVQLVKGDDFVKQENLPIPTAVKIDVEGYEYDVINGLRQTLSDPMCKILCCEVHTTLLPEGITTNSITALLKSIGFKDIDIHSRDSEYHVIAHKP